MKVKLASIAVLALITGVGVWQVTSLQTTPTQAVVLNITTPSCKSTPYLSTLKSVWTSAETKIKNISQETKNYGTAVTSQVKAISTQETVTIAGRKKSVATASSTLAAKVTVYNGIRVKVSAPTSALTPKQLESLKKQESDAKIAVDKATTELTRAQTSLQTEIDRKATMQTELDRRKALYATYTSGAVAKERTAARDVAKATYNQELARTKNLKECPRAETVAQCTNGIDDDGDGKGDCSDSECSTIQTCKDQVNTVIVNPGTNPGVTPPGGNNGNTGTTTNNPVIVECEDGTKAPKGDCPGENGSKKICFDKFKEILNFSTAEKCPIYEKEIPGIREDGSEDHVYRTTCSYFLQALAADQNALEDEKNKVPRDEDSIADYEMFIEFRLEHIRKHCT